MTYPPTNPPHQVYYPAYAMPQKSVGVAYVLWFFFGLLGIHQFYLGKVGRGLLYLFTGGVLGIGWLIDLFTLPAQTRQVNVEWAAGIRR